MDTVPPSYQSATARDAWSMIATYIPSSDLCAVSLVCRKWHQLFMPFLWGDPASHFGTDNDAVYVALTRFRRTLKYARPEVRMLTHTLHLPPALSEIYGGPRPEWLREVLTFLPCLQSLIVSRLPFFDHNAMTGLKNSGQIFNIRLLIADKEPNTTSQGIAETLLCLPELVYLDLSFTTPARDRAVLSSISQLEHLQVLKLRGIGLKDHDAQFLANAIGIRVRYLDLRNNMLTDMAVRSLLQASFLPSGNTGAEDGRSRREDESNQPFPSLPLTRLLASSLVDEQIMKALTQPLTGHSWVEDLSHVGLTHLYVSDNQITVEGAASLLAASRLHSLDIGTVDTAEALTKGQRSISSPPEEPGEFPGAEKLVPILGTVARENLTYLRAHHAVCTADVSLKDFVAQKHDVLLPELPAGDDNPLPRATELDASHEIHELPTEFNTVFELDGTPIPEPSSPVASDISPPTIYEDDSRPNRRRGSAFAPEVLENKQTLCRSETSNSRMTVSSGLPDIESQAMESAPRSMSPLSADDPRFQKIKELIAKRPRNQDLPRKDKRQNNFPFLHPSHVPHLETLVLTDVPSHVPAGSPILASLIRFITACSNEAHLAILQAGSDYSLPPGRARAKAEQERARSLFALRRIILEITPVSPSNGPSKLTPWTPVSYQTGAERSSTGDRDSENLWSAAISDFSFFGDDECGIPENDPGKYFPMAVLNQKVSLLPEEDEAGSSSPDSSAGFLHPNSYHRSTRHRSPSASSARSSHSMSTSTSTNKTIRQNQSTDTSSDPRAVDLVSELASFRRAKKAEYEEAVLRGRKRRSTTSSLLSPSTPTMRPSSPSPSLAAGSTGMSNVSLSHFVEGHWRGEVKIVRNPAPKGRSGVVDMYGNYFEKGYLYP